MKKISGILIATFLLCSAAGIAYPTSMASEDRFHGDSSSVFTPGYINSVKSHTNSIINQLEQKKGLWQRAVEYLQDRLGKDTEEDSNTVATLELKKKTGGSGSTTNTAATENVAYDTAAYDQGTMTAVLNDIINKGASVTQLDNGNVVTLWKEGDNQYFGVINALGQTTIEKRLIDPVGTQHNWVDNIYDMGNGKFVINMWGSNGESITEETDSSLWLGTWTNTQSLIQYDSFTGEVEDSMDYVTSYSNHYNSYYDAYRWNDNRVGDSSYYSSWATNITYLDNGSLAMVVGSYSGTNNGDGNDYSLRIFENGFNTYKDYNLDEYRSYWGGLTINGISSLGNDRFVMATHQYDFDGTSYAEGTNFTVLDTDFNKYADLYMAQGSEYYDGEQYTWDYQEMKDLVSLGNGKFAVGWNNSTYTENSIGSSSYSNSASIDIFSLDTNGEGGYYLNRKDSGMTTSLYERQEDGDIGNSSYSQILDMKALDDGSLVVAVNSTDEAYKYAAGYSHCMGLYDSFSADSYGSIKVMDSQGNIKDIAIDSVGGDYSISNLTTIGNTFGITLGGDLYGDGDSYLGTQQFSQDNSYSQVSEKQPGILENKLDSTSMNTPLTADDIGAKEAINAGNLKTDLSGNLLTADGAPLYGIDLNGMSPNGLLMRLNSYLTSMAALSVYSAFSDTGNSSQLMAALSHMLNNPSEEQKKMIDAVSALLTNLTKKDTEGESILSREEMNDLVKAITATMLAQAIPDLFSENDMANIKGAFLALSMEKTRIFKDYDSSTKQYYDEIVKEIAGNMGMLQADDIISKGMTKKELNKLTRNEIDKIIEKIKRAEKRSVETERILLEEAKYRKMYIEPGKKLMEERMKSMIKSYTGKVNSVIKSAAKDMDTKKK